MPVPAPTAMAKSGTLQGESEESLSADEDAEIDSHAQPQAGPAEATNCEAKADGVPPTERSSTPKEDKKKPQLKPRKPSPNRTTAAQEPLAKPGCYPVTEGRRVLTQFPLWDATAPLSLPLSKYSLDTLQAETGLNCAMRNAMEGRTTATWKERLAWLTLVNFITRRWAVALLFFYGWWVTVRHFFFWTSVWAIVGCTYVLSFSLFTLVFPCERASTGSPSA